MIEPGPFRVLCGLDRRQFAVFTCYWGKRVFMTLASFISVHDPNAPIFHMCHSVSLSCHWTPHK